MKGAVNPAVIAAHAAAWTGTPWHARAALRGVGADCVGLIRGILADVSAHIITPPPYLHDWHGTPDPLILDAGNRHLIPADGRAGQVVAFRIGAGPVSHVGVRLDAERIVHVCTRRGTVETRAPWHVAGAWDFPLAAGCETGDPEIAADDLLAIVFAEAGAVHYAIQDMRDATPLSRSRPYPSAADALAAIPPAILHIERV